MLQRLDRRARDGVGRGKSPVIVSDVPRPVRLAGEHDCHRPRSNAGSSSGSTSGVCSSASSPSDRDSRFVGRESGMFASPASVSSSMQQNFCIPGRAPPSVSACWAFKLTVANIRSSVRFCLGVSAESRRSSTSVREKDARCSLSLLRAPSVTSTPIVKQPMQRSFSGRPWWCRMRSAWRAVATAATSSALSA